MLELVEKRNAKGRILGDLEKLPFGYNTFHGIWAYTSLLHVPKKKFPGVLSEILGFLKPMGIFYIGMKEGDFEGWKESENYPGHKRYVSYYREGELEDYLWDGGFGVVHRNHVFPNEESEFMGFFCERH